MGRIIYVHQARRCDDSADHVDRGAHLDRGIVAAGDPAGARAADAGRCRDLAALPVSGLSQQRNPLDADRLGERSLDAGLATILNSTSPIFTFFLTLAITRHETLTARKLFGVLAGMAGICLVVGVQALGGLGEQLAAEIATVVATICYAGAAIFSRGFKGLDPTRRQRARCSVARRS